MRWTAVYLPMRLLTLLLLVICAMPAAEVVNANVASEELAPVIPEGKLFHAVITVKNPHDRAIKISKIDSTCTCAKLEIASKFLIPGETTTLAVDVETNRRSGPQHVQITLYVSDFELEPIEVMSWWNVRPAVTVDAIERGKSPLERPADNGWRDIYRYVSHERPDEAPRLTKRIRLSSPPEDSPQGGLRVEGIDYTGKLWTFTSADQGNGSILITATATARDEKGLLPQGAFVETVTVRTNHPNKLKIELHFEATIDYDAGRAAKDPMGMPPGMPPMGP
ncbi:MAG: DUF1573 domain-containing protein [Planctomycetota bacterium]